ncbi:MAG: sugar phosphate isomerase/epimerase [Caldilineaceae bacterium]
MAKSFVNELRITNYASPTSQGDNTHVTPPHRLRPTTWKNVPEETVLAEIATAGYDGAPAAPREGRTAQDLVHLYAAHGLSPAPGYLSGDFWDAAQADSILARAKDYARFAKAVGCTELYVAASGFNWVTPRGLTRRQVAGHVKPGDALSDAQFRQFADTLNRVGEITLASGVRSCFHNHVGTVIETGEEVDRLFALLDPDLVFMGPDTGHLAWAGVDVVSFCRDYADRILTMHIKDIDPNVLAQGVAAEWDYGQFSDNGVFTELGLGFVDFPTVFDILDKAGFDGWLIVETDVTQQETAYESARMSRAYLRSIGI